MLIAIRHHLIATIILLILFNIEIATTVIILIFINNKRSFETLKCSIKFQKNRNKATPFVQQHEYFFCNKNPRVNFIEKNSTFN